MTITATTAATKVRFRCFMAYLPVVVGGIICYDNLFVNTLSQFFFILDKLEGKRGKYSPQRYIMLKSEAP